MSCRVTLARISHAAWLWRALGGFGRAFQGVSILIWSAASWGQGKATGHPAKWRGYD
jgi:hypothetical protein